MFYLLYFFILAICFQKTPIYMSSVRRPISVSKSHNLDIALVVSFSFNIESKHQQEILLAMHQNIFVMPVHVLYDGPKNECARVRQLLDEMYYPISCTYFGTHMPTYFDMISFLKTMPSLFVVLSNADIIFDDSIYFSKHLPPNGGYAISWSSWHGSMPKGERRSRCLPKEHRTCSSKQKEWVLNCWPDRLYSIDSFVMRTWDLQRVTDDGFYDFYANKKYRMNIPGAEFAFIGALEHHGIHFQNACRLIKTKHIHHSPKSHLLSRQSRVYSKYGVYQPQVRHRQILKEIIFVGAASETQYKLPIGI